MVKLTTLPLHLARSLHQQTSTVCITADAAWWPRETLELVPNPKRQSSFFLQVRIHLINPGRSSQNRPNGSMLLWGHSVEVKSGDFGGPIQGTQVDSSQQLRYFSVNKSGGLNDQQIDSMPRRAGAPACLKLLLKSTKLPHSRDQMKTLIRHKCTLWRKRQTLFRPCRQLRLWGKTLQ